MTDFSILLTLILSLALVFLIILSVNSSGKLTCKRLERTSINCYKEDKSFRTLFGILPNSRQSFRIVGTELKIRKYEDEARNIINMYELYLIDKKAKLIYLDTYTDKEVALIQKRQIERFINQPTNKQENLTIKKSFWWQPFMLLLVGLIAVSGIYLVLRIN